MGQDHDAPERYLRLMRSALPRYDELQDEVARAAAGLAVGRMLDLGTGTGETARRCLAARSGAALVATDASAAMLDVARDVLGASADLRLARLEDDLPAGPFELIVSALAVHHLDGAEKADLFRRVREALAPGGRFVMGDVVITDEPVPHPSPLDPAIDRPDRLADLLDWLRAASLEPSVTWADGDLVVVAAQRGVSPGPPRTSDSAIRDTRSVM